MKVIQRRTQEETAQRRRKSALISVAAVVALLVAFVAVTRLVPGPVTRGVVERSIGSSLGAIEQPKCDGPLSTMRCELQDDSGTKATYLVTTSKSCWHAALADPNAGVEMLSEVHRCMHVHLWDNIFS
jgi:hypothetical protein